MYISNIKIRNFRAIKNLDLNLNKGLNVLIGENNSGKTGIIDALRLVLEESNYPKETYWNESDFRIDSDYDTIKPIEIDIRFEITDYLECAWFSELHYVEIVNDKPNHYLDLHCKVELVENKSRRKFKRKIWGGKDEENKVSYEVLGALNYIYLSPLRDVNKDFKLNRYNLLAKLFTNILLDEDEEKDKLMKKELSGKIEDKFKAEEWVNLINKGKNSINSHLKGMGFLDDFNEVDIKFSSFEFEDLVSKLILQIPIDKDTNFDLNQNGLGYNNLIYVATIFGDIIERNNYFEEDYNLLLIEEPEAHLHPQLENTFFNYLNKLDKKDDFQIIVSSHSPVITAKTKLKNVIILQNEEGSIVSTVIKDIPLEDENVRFLEKFLDVTKSQFFFSKGVILVEGITEALLLSTFSKIMDIQSGNDNKIYDLEKNGIEVIVTGTSFSHYAKLFTDDDKNKRLNFRGSIITDCDSNKRNGKGRVKNLLDLKKNNLNVFYTKYTFECDLFDSNNENDIILTVFDNTHPKIRKGLDESEEFNVKKFITSLESNQSKSDFAYNLSRFLDNKINEYDINNSKDNCIFEFKVPNYIENAIKFVVGEDIGY